MQQQEATPLSLPYPEIEVVTNRDVARKLLKDVGGRMGRQTMYVPIDQISVRDENFNFRRQPEGMDRDQWLYGEHELDIRNLADGIFQNCGPKQPLILDLIPDGTYYINDGFRRHMACKLLIETGRDIYPDGREVRLLEAFINPGTTTELDRMVSIFTTQDNKKLKPTEIAWGLKRIKDVFGYTHEQIAEKIGKSRQYVDGKIALAEEPLVIRQAVEDGKLSETAAVALTRTVKSETQRVNMVEDSINSGTPLKVNQVSKQEAKEKKENAEQLQLTLDVSQEKMDAEYECNNVIKNADGIRKYLKGLNDQNRGDVEQRLDWIIASVEKAREFIKQAPEKR